MPNKDPLKPREDETALEKIGRLSVRSTLSNRYYLCYPGPNPGVPIDQAAEEERERLRQEGMADAREAESAIQEYIREYAYLACPECGSDQVEQTLRGCLGLNTNSARCGKCGATGLVCDWETLCLMKAFPRYEEKP